MAFYVRIYILITHYLLYFRKVSSKGFKQHFAKCSSSVTALKSQQATISIPCVHSPYFKLLVFKCNSSVSNRMVPKIRGTILRVYFCYLLFMSLYFTCFCVWLYVCVAVYEWICLWSPEVCISSLKNWISYSIYSIHTWKHEHIFSLKAFLFRMLPLSTVVLSLFLP